MEPRPASPTTPDPDASEFVRFCYRRRRVGWPELYDEMCAVAARGLFRGMSTDDLGDLGIGFSLYDMPALAVLSNGIVAEEQAKRRPMAVMIRAEGPSVAGAGEGPAIPEVAGPTDVDIEVPVVRSSVEPMEADVTGHALEPVQATRTSGSGRTQERGPAAPIRLVGAGVPA